MYLRFKADIVHEVLWTGNSPYTAWTWHFYGQVVILNVAGSSPVTHPMGQRWRLGPDLFISEALVSLGSYLP